MDECFAKFNLQEFYKASCGNDVYCVCAVCNKLYYETIVLDINKTIIFTTLLWIHNAIMGRFSSYTCRHMKVNLAIYTSEVFSILDA